MTHEGAFGRRVACRLAISVLICLSIVGVVSWQSAGNDRAVAAVQPQNRVAANSAQPTGSVKYYVVRRGYDGKKEFLFEIAQRFLGNGNLYTEIFNLNKGRPQPGGGSLQNPTTVLPGWILVLPSDARGSGVQFGPLPKVVASATPTAPHSVKYYVVRRSYDGQQEFLFEIAQRFLGNGNLYTEIFNLNKGRPQPGGGSLQNPTSVLPGWILVLPSDAHGSGVQFGPLPKVVVLATPTTPQKTTPHNGSSPTPPASQSPASRSPASHGSSAVLWVAVGIVVVVIAAAAIVAIMLRRRRRKPAVRNAAPTTPVDGSAVWTIDRALKALTTACDDEGIAFPGAYLVTVDAASVRVTMSKPSAKAPAGWTASSDGRTWRAQLAALQASNVRDTGGHSFAGLVMLGASDDGQVLLDLDQATGPISIDGPKGTVDEIVEAWVAQLTTNPWSATVRVAHINARNEPNLESAENLLADLSADERALIVFEQPPSRSQTAALRALFTSATTAWTLIKGTAPVATWKFTADGGVISSGFLPDIRYSASPGTPSRSLLFRAGS